LFPWLGLNVKISYQCDRKKDILRSIGLHLINGRMVEGFHDRLLQLDLTPKIPDYSYTISPLIMPKSGILRIKNFLREEILREDHQWALEARQRWEKDLKLLEHFYEDGKEKGESYHNEKEALQNQYEPKIIISVINGGLFYLTEKRRIMGFTIAPQECCAAGLRRFRPRHCIPPPITAPRFVPQNKKVSPRQLTFSAASILAADSRESFQTTGKEIPVWTPFFQTDFFRSSFG